MVEMFAFQPNEGNDGDEQDNWFFLPCDECQKPAVVFFVDGGGGGGGMMMFRKEFFRSQSFVLFRLFC